jgi:glucokinase
MQKPVLVGDIGGTNSRFGLATRSNEGFSLSAFRVLANDDHENFEAVLQAYLLQAGQSPTQACFAVAGIIDDGSSRLTNRGWDIDRAVLKAAFGLSDLIIINDFHAMARSVPELAASAFEDIFPGEPVRDEPVLVTGPGTGFGVATLFKDAGSQWNVLFGEGGHMAYAPREPLEFDVASRLRARHGYVSNELVASGSGLNAVYEVFCEIFGRQFVALSAAQMREKAESGDEMYLQLIRLRALAVMGAAGDLALANGTRGGVILAGGVSQRLVKFLGTPEARARFVERGPMSDFLKDCPVKLLNDPEAPLIGAAARFFEVVPESG